MSITVPVGGPSIAAGSDQIGFQGGVPVYTSNGGPVTAMGGSVAGTFRQSAAADAGSVLGVASANMVDYFESYAQGASPFQIILSGSGTLQTDISDNTDAVNTIGGVIELGTGVTAGAGNGARVIPTLATNRAPMAGFNTATVKFYRQARLRLSSAPTADSICWTGSIGFRMGVLGSASTTKYALQVKSTGSNYIVSTVNIDTAFHQLRAWHDGTKAWFAVDGETPQSLADVGLFPLSNFDESFCEYNSQKAAGAVNHLIQFKYQYWAVVSP